MACCGSNPLITRILSLVLCTPQVLCCALMVRGFCGSTVSPASGQRAVHTCCRTSRDMSNRPSDQQRDDCQLCSSWNAVLSKRSAPSQATPLELATAPAFFQPLHSEAPAQFAVAFHSQIDLRACPTTLLDLACQFTT